VCHFTIAICLVVCIPSSKADSLFAKCTCSSIYINVFVSLYVYYYVVHLMEYIQCRPEMWITSHCTCLSDSYHRTILMLRCLVSLVCISIVRSLGCLSKLLNMSDTFIFSRFSSAEVMTLDMAHSIRETKREITGRVTSEPKKAKGKGG
jgi:hypothetical protein